MMRRTGWLLVALVVGLGGRAEAGCPQGTWQRLPPLLRGTLDELAGRHAQAIAACDEVLRNDPDHSRAHALRGYAHLSEEGGSRQAIADFSAAIRLHPDDAWLHVAGARAYRMAEDYDRAIADCTEAIRIDRTSGDAYGLRGEIYFLKKVMGKAIADYSAALRIDPRLSWARSGRGAAYLWRGGPARALADLEEVLRQDPHDESARRLRCFVYLFGHRDFDRVIADASEFIRLDPKESFWYSVRSLAHLAKGETAKGLIDAAAAVRLNPRGLVLRLRPNSLFLGFGSVAGNPMTSEDDSAQRIEACTKRLADDPNNVAAYYERACAFLVQHDCKRAAADLDEVIRRDPADAEAYRERGGVLVDLGALPAAIGEFTKAIHLDPDAADGYVGRARAYGAMERTAEALADCANALRLDPRLAAAHVFQGWIRFNRREYDEAIADYSEALRLSPADADTYTRRAGAYQLKGYYGGAIADCKHALQLDSGDARVRSCLAWYLATCPDARLRNGKEAREYATTACEATSWREGQFLDTLAAACAECGDFEEAIRWEGKALERAPVERITECLQRLELYKAHKPYHWSPPPTMPPPSK
jgi:tetratricopeptide (TPR) repeat protein